jgi:hypothetical protein
MLPNFRQFNFVLLSFLFYTYNVCSFNLRAEADNEAVQEEKNRIEECTGKVYVIKPKVTYIARGYVQEFRIEPAPETALLVQSGTSLQADKHRPDALIMSEGRVLAITGKHEQIDLITDFGEVEVPKSTFAIIEYTPEGIIRIENLMGNSMTWTFRMGHIPYTFSAASGDEIFGIQDEEVDPKYLPPEDGVYREQRESYVVQGCQVKRTVFDQKMMVEREHLLLYKAESEDLAERIAFLKKKAKPFPSSRGMEREPLSREQLACGPRIYRVLRA